MERRGEVLVKRASFNQEKERISVKKRRYDTVRTQTRDGGVEREW